MSRSLGKDSRLLMTTDFCRLWYEPAFGRLGIGSHQIEAAAESRKKWFPFSKGGSFRRWYGNNDFVVNWEANGSGNKGISKPRSVEEMRKYIFRSWSYVVVDFNCKSFFSVLRRRLS